MATTVCVCVTTLEPESEMTSFISALAIKGNVAIKIAYCGPDAEDGIPRGEVAASQTFMSLQSGMQQEHQMQWQVSKSLQSEDIFQNNRKLVQIFY